MPTPVTPAQGASIVRFLRGRLGHKIGRRGECWDAAEQAIQSIGARRPDADALYVWGTTVQPDNLRPGDILQFSRFTIATRNEDGSSRTVTLGQPQHTAIVESVNDDGSVNVLHQNFRGRVVTTLENVYLSGGEYGDATVTVSGSLTCYRPQMP